MMPSPCVCLDSQRRSCLVLDYGSTTVELIIMNSELLQVQRIGMIEFMGRFSPTDYPIDRAAAHYLHAAKVISITPDASLRLLNLAKNSKPAEAPREVGYAANFIDFQGQPGSPVLGSSSDHSGNEDHDMATKKPAADKKAAPKKPAAKPTAKKPAVKEKATSGRKPGTGALITEMLLAGKTNDAILEKVRSQFPDSTANASTVSWYRSKLKKEGQLK